MRFLPTLLLLTSCLQVRYQTDAMPLGNTVTRQAVSAEQVVVYRSAEQVPGKFVEVALLTPDGDPAVSKGAMTSMRMKAGSLGANAVILLPASAATSTASRLDYDGAVRTSSNARYRAVAIYVQP